MRVQLVDAHGVMRAGLQALLQEQDGLQVVGAAGDGAEALRLAEQSAPDVILMGMNLPDMSPVQLIRQLREVAPTARVLVLAALGDTVLVREAIDAGAAGYVLKRATQSELMSALAAANRGDIYLDPGLTRSLVGHPAEGGGRRGCLGPGLTEGERCVLQLIARGFTNREIAHELHISERTVESRRANLRAKLDAHSRAELVRYAQGQPLPNPTHVEHGGSEPGS